MKYDFIIFGGTGLQGRICARDLLESGFSTLLVGRNPDGIQNLLKKYQQKSGFMRVDLMNQMDIVNAIIKSKANLVINCAELIFNVQIMRACLKTKKSLTDLGGLQNITRQQFKLHSNFKKTGIINITGCGSTPGISNVMVAHAVKHFDSIETIYLGFAWDSNIKEFIIPYSIKSIFDELKEAPITFHKGKFIKENRITCKGVMNFKEIGQQTVYCIVHSEVYTFAKYFKNLGIKNIHYMAGFPDHSLRVIQLLMDLGFDSDNAIEIQGHKIKPSDFTIQVLKKIPVPKGYKEKEDLWVRVEGIRKGKKHHHEMDCIIKTLDGWEEAGSNVDTGRTISIISQMLFKGLIKGSGVYGPEAVVPQNLFFKELAKRKMFIYEDGRKIN